MRASGVVGATSRTNASGLEPSRSSSGRSAPSGRSVTRTPCTPASAFVVTDISEEEIADGDAIALGIFSSDDRAAESASLILLGEVGEWTRIEAIAHLVAHEPHDGTRDRFGIRIRGVHHRQLVR